MSCVKDCAQIKVDFLPDNNLKLPRFIQIVPIPLEEALFQVFPDSKPRLNLAAIFAKFERTSVGAKLQKWSPVQDLVSWSGLHGRFEYVLEHFVRHLPCG